VILSLLIMALLLLLLAVLLLCTLPPHHTPHTHAHPHSLTHSLTDLHNQVLRRRGVCCKLYYRQQLSRQGSGSHLRAAASTVHVRSHAPVFLFFLFRFEFNLLLNFFRASSLFCFTGFAHRVRDLHAAAFVFAFLRSLSPSQPRSVPAFS